MYFKQLKQVFFVYGLSVICSVASADIFDQSLSVIAQSNRMRNDSVVLTEPSTGLAAWIDNPQARLSFEESHSGGLDSSYRMRFNPIPRKEQRASRTISNLRQDRQKLGRSEHMLDEMNVVYQHVVDIVRGELEERNLTQKLELLNLSTQYHQSLAQTDEFNPERLQKVNIDTARMNKAKQVNEIRIRQLRLAIAGAIESSEDLTKAALDSNAIISPKEIWSLVEQQKTDWFEKTMSRRSAIESLTTRILQEEVGLSKAQSGFGFNLMEFELNNSSSGNSIGVTFGFRLPNIGSNTELIRRQLDFAEANEKNVAKDFINVQTINELIDALELNFREWSAYDELLSKYSGDGDSSAAGDPELILIQSEEQLSLSQRVSDSYVNMLRAYVDLISFSGTIIRLPLRNWLKTGQPVIAGL